MIMAQQNACDGSNSVVATNTTRKHTDDVATRQIQQNRQLQEKTNNFVAEISNSTHSSNSSIKTIRPSPFGNIVIPTTRTNKTTTTKQQETARQLQQTDQQDGKRTLIKNQLYLIEQLQLENANLRNERDQLQLENEELKFQLQMIR